MARYTSSFSRDPRTQIDSPSLSLVLGAWDCTTHLRLEIRRQNIQRSLEVPQPETKKTK